MELSDAPSPRLCHIIKWPDFDGYGFNLHAEKSKAGQYIGKVDDDSPAERAGLREGDRIIEVNMVNISNENHRQVVERIKSVPNETKLLVVDDAADRWYKERKIVVKSNMPNVIFNKTPVPRPSAKNNDESLSPPTKMNGDNTHVNDEPNDVNHYRNHNNNINGSSVREESPVLENGAISSRSSTPQSIPSFQKNNNGEMNKRPSSGGSDAKTSSIPGSPTSTKSGSSNGPSYFTDAADLNLNMTASEMRQRIAQKKKTDAKKAQIDMKQKYEIIQQM